MASVAKRPDGRWRARYRDEAGKEHAKHFDRKIDAQRWLDEVTASVITGTYVDPKAGRVTFDAFARGWAARQVWETSTSRAMHFMLQSVTFGAVPLAQLRASHVEAWVKSMSSAGLAASTIASRMNGARAVLKAAVRDRVIAVDPSAGVTLPRRRRAEHAMSVPTSGDVGALLDASEPYHRVMWALGAFAGLRPGEAVAVQAGDIDFLRRRLHVTRQVQRGAVGGGLEVRPPKYGSERDVALPDGLLNLLAAHLEEYGHGTAGWLVLGAGGGPVAPSTSNGWWRATSERAGLQVRQHDLRHFYASGLIAAGCDVVTVQRALGHSSPTTTLDTYSHLWPTAEDRTRSAAEDLMAQSIHTTKTKTALLRGPSGRASGEARRGVGPS
ncbi:tyrosine-type recombinase/integrase [Cellulomonas iranensis]|uniref:tyrosine-type recombinase/integrase n=1 Tax=Cellulomonas iranensis TaxID=76862 RepID=UPI003D7D19A8